MRMTDVTSLAVCLLLGMESGLVMAAAETNPPLRLMTLEPGHFHAALMQKQMQPDLSAQVDVYALPGPDLGAHLARIDQFNARAQNPTYWDEIVHTNGVPLDRLLAEHPGNVVVMAGNNAGKIDRIQAIVAAGISVLADKPWIITTADFPKLAATLATADTNRVVAYDAMTQRFEITCLLPRELVNTPAVFGQLADGTAEEPAVDMASLHYLLKEVAGLPLLRPPWFFDIRQQGEALADVGTHLADLVPWTIFPDQALNYRTDIQLLSATRWPTIISLPEFQKVTGESVFPAYLADALQDGKLQYYANNTVIYTLRHTFVRLKLQWGFAAPAGSKDAELAIFRGTQARVEVRQGAAENYVAQVYVIPNRPALHGTVATALTAKVAELQTLHPGLAVKDLGDRFQIKIPDALRIGHEAHFALLTRRFLDYVHHPESQPAWEQPNLLAKYFLTTAGVELARKNTQP